MYITIDPPRASLSALFSHISIVYFSSNQDSTISRNLRECQTRVTSVYFRKTFPGNTNIGKISFFPVVVESCLIEFRSEFLYQICLHIFESFSLFSLHNKKTLNSRDIHTNRSKHSSFVESIGAEIIFSKSVIRYQSRKINGRINQYSS